jgi:hypothetical protein
LYKQSAKIKKDILYRITKLPRESVIKDLEKVLIDSIARFDYFNKNTDIDIPFAPIYALMILSVMKAEESLDTLFTVLRQDIDYYDMWYGNMITEDFWRCIYMMGQNRLDRLKDFVLEPNRYTFVLTAVSDAMMNIAFHQPIRKEEVFKWYEDVLQNMKENKNNNTIFDRHVYLSLLEDLIEIAGKEQFPLVMRFYDENLKRDFDNAPLSIKKIKIKLAKKARDYKIHEIYTSIDQYYDRWQSWFKNEDKKGGKISKNKSFLPSHFKPSTPQIETPQPPKIGRNDPCPCGSGKKYKKCCGAD